MRLRRNFLIPLIALALTSLTACTPAQRALFARWYTAGVAAAPQPVSDLRCPPGPIKTEIQKTFGFAAPWAESIAMRESHCDPSAHNGSSGSAGIFQLLGHDDLLRDACPGLTPSSSWAIAHCNIRAAKRLFDGSGITPWQL